LSAELAATIAVLDPAGGAKGIGAQIKRIAAEHHVDRVAVVDVGGDILGRPEDPGLRSPLADALVAAACAAVGVPTDVLIAGPGLDGEVDEESVIARAGGLPPAITLTAESVAPVSLVLAWHPSEATALLVAAARGIRGTVEIREGGLPVVLTEHSADVLAAHLADVLDVSPLAKALAGCDSLSAAEQIGVDMLGFTELEHEREKATRLDSGQHTEPAEPVRAASTWLALARRRGVTYTTFRRIAEAIGHRDVPRLREALVRADPARLADPLWRVA
jgi:hypothetical protein